MGYFYLSAAHKSSGKTTISLGLAAAMHRRRGLVVQTFKKGPDYIDPLWLGSAADRPCYNLDFFIQTREEILNDFNRRMTGVDIGLIEGNKGLFDGLTLDGSDSNAALAALLDAPVVLVIDARGMTRGIAPLLLGYQQFTPRVRLAGVVFNRVGVIRHETKLRKTVEHYTDIPVLGAVPESGDMQIVERHLGLMPSNEHDEAASIIERISGVIENSVDIDAVIDAASSAPVITPPVATASSVSSADGEPLRIGVPRDAAFGFYYPGDLEALRAAGANLVFFSVIEDEKLPAIDGLFLGGGFPEASMSTLEANQTMRASIRTFVEDGGPVYAECGGLMYLCRRLVWGDKVCEMAGVIPADAVMYERPQGRGYVRLRVTEDHPWPVSSGATAGVVLAHEFHYSQLENIDTSLTFAYQMERGQGVDGSHDGIVHKNLLASYAHLRDVAGYHWTKRFIAHVKSCRL